MIRGWRILVSPSVIGLGPPLSTLAESLAAADTAVAIRILKAALTSFIVAFACMWVVLFSRLDL